MNLVIYDAPREPKKNFAGQIPSENKTPAQDSTLLTTGRAPDLCVGYGV